MNAFFVHLSILLPYSVLQNVVKSKSTVLRNGTSNYVTDYYTQRSRFLLEKLTGPQLSRNSPQFVKREELLPHSRAPTTCHSLRSCKSIPNILNSVVSTSPTAKLEDYPLSAARDCLFNIFAPTLCIQGPSLHPTPEKAPCCGDSDSHTRYGTNPNYKEINTHDTTIENEIVTATTVI